MFKRDSLLLLQDLLRCDDDQCLLPKDAGYLLIESLEKNQRLPLKSKLHSAVLGLQANFILDRDKNVEFAEELFRRAINIDPTVIQNYVDYSQLLALLGRNGEIDQVIDKALSMTNNKIDIDILEQLRILLTHP